MFQGLTLLLTRPVTPAYDNCSFFFLFRGAQEKCGDKLSELVTQSSESNKGNSHTSFLLKMN